VIGRHRLHGELNQKKSSKKIQSHNGIVHEFVQSFLDIMKSKDHEKLSFIVGTSQKRCNSGHNSPQAIKFFKSNIEAVKLWTIIYLLESKSSFRTSTNFKIEVPMHSETKTNAMLADCKNNGFISDRKNLDCHSGTSSSRFARMADSIICVPYQESLTPVHELRAIFCSRLLVVGANCLAIELIEDEEMTKETVKINKNRKKSKKKSKSTALIIKDKIHSIDDPSSSPSAAQLNILDTVLPLNISMSPHLLTHQLVLRSEACIFIGRLVDQIVDSVSVCSAAKSTVSTAATGTGTISVTAAADNTGGEACPRDIKLSLKEENSELASPAESEDMITSKLCETIAAAPIKDQKEKSLLTVGISNIGGDGDGDDFYFPSAPSRPKGAASDTTHKTQNTRTSSSLSPSSKLSVSPPDLDSGYRWSDMALYPVLEKYRAQNSEEVEQERQEFAFIKGKGKDRGQQQGADGDVGEGRLGCLGAPSDVFGGWAFDDTLGTVIPMF
jgi:hypothetical protein